jgi:hypothetical protein
MEEFLRNATKEKSKKGDDIDKVLGEELKEIAKGGKHNIEVRNKRERGRKGIRNNREKK